MGNNLNYKSDFMTDDEITKEILIDEVKEEGVVKMIWKNWIESNEKNKKK